ncbi:MAG: intradiol ring-cleavage dioxygenase [Gemmatimonadales bacterium]
MRPTQPLFILVSLLAAASPAPAQSRPDLFDCENCEAIHEHSFEGLPSSTVIPPPGEPGERLVLVGRVLQADGTSPAPGVIVLAYHANAAGAYPKRGDERGWGRWQGYLRGWVKTDAEGRYRFETVRPGPYPGRSEPAHIHMIVKEPDRREYWIDDVVFEDDPRVTAAYRARVGSRGGPGIVRPTGDASGVWHATRDIVLER